MAGTRPGTNGTSGRAEPGRLSESRYSAGRGGGGPPALRRCPKDASARLATPAPHAGVTGIDIDAGTIKQAEAAIACPTFTSRSAMLPQSGNRPTPWFPARCCITSTPTRHDPMMRMRPKQRCAPMSHPWSRMGYWSYEISARTVRRTRPACSVCRTGRDRTDGPTSIFCAIMPCVSARSTRWAAGFPGGVGRTRARLAPLPAASAMVG